MDLGEVMARHGGLSSRAALIRATSRAEVDRALAAGVLVRAGHGRYVLPEVDAAARTAHAMNGVLCLTSAALHHGWEVKAAPDKPHVLVPRKRNVPDRLRRAVVLHRRDLGPDDVSAGATSRELTLAQCLRLLPYDEALVIADSALRNGEHATLARAAALVQGRGQQQAARVAREARAESANAFESATRASSRRSSSPTRSCGRARTWWTATSSWRSSASPTSGTATGPGSARTYAATRCSRPRGGWWSGSPGRT
jgi:hypothetical protein